MENNDTTIVKRKNGRPLGSTRKFELSEDKYQIIDNCFQMNMSYQDISKIIGISEKTFDKYVKKDLRLKNIKDTSRLKSLTYVYSKLWKLIEEEDKTAIFFWLRNMGRDYFFENKSNQHTIGLNDTNTNVNPTLLMNNFKQNILKIDVNNSTDKVTNEKK